MKQPLWAINSSLLLLLLVAELVFFLLHTPIPRRVSLEPDQISVQDKKLGLVISIEKIYQANDLFGTYVPPAPSQPKALAAQEVIPAIPEAPSLIPLQIPIEPEKVFIAPLAVTLKGIMYNYDNPEKNIAIIQFQQSKEEINYRVGQLISDAQILKIYPNRVILIRSNGQQETLYLKENEATQDMKIETLKNISDITIPIRDGIYYLPVASLKHSIKSLAQFIEILDLTTVYQKGKSIGCRIGKSGKDTFASKLGLAKDDIIQQIDEIPVTDMASRVLIYNHMMQKQVGDVIDVKLDRLGKELHLKYMLSDASIISTIPQTQKAQAKFTTPQQIFNLEEERKKILEQRVKLAPTAQQIQTDERNKILQARHKELFANKMVVPENAPQPKMAYNILPKDQTFGMLPGANG